MLIEKTTISRSRSDDFLTELINEREWTKALDYYCFSFLSSPQLPFGDSGKQRGLRQTDHLLREDCGYQLLYTKQLNREHYEGPVGERGQRGAGDGV